jgi:uncharacterized protein (DUF433 family)
MSRTITLHLNDEQAEQLERRALQRGQTPEEAANVLLAEGLQASENEEFALIEHRDTPAGRLAYLKDSRVTVEFVANLYEAYGGDLNATSEHLVLPIETIEAAISYAAAHPAEMEATRIRTHPSLEELRQLIPHLEVVTVDPSLP